MLRIVRGLSIALVLPALACSSDGPAGPGGGDDVEAGTFEATVSGAATATFSGIANFASVTNQGFVMTLSSNDGTGVIGVYRADAGRPGTGTLQLGDASLATTTSYASGLAGGASFHSTTGVLTITRSTAGSLQGTLQFEGPGTTGGGANGNFTINATFDATCLAIGTTCN